MRCAVCLLICLVGCEPMEAPGGFAAITKPVDVAPAPSSAPAVEPALAFEEPVVIRSEEIQDKTPKPAPTPAPAPAPAPAPEQAGSVDAPEATDAADAGGADAPDGAPGEALISLTQGGFPGGTGWPLRLVKTLPDTNPPRAVLGLPNGEEIVVTPGKMIPAHNLVVMSIGPRSAELARISAEGDHANVQPVSLQTQY